MLVDEARHLEHRDLALSTENRTEILVGVDHAAVLAVLETSPLDVMPELLRDFGARERARADDVTEL